MAVPYLYIEDTDGNVYNFPLEFWIYDDPLNHTRNIKNIAFSSGGKNVADGYQETRTISLQGALRADTLSELETIERNFNQAVLKGGYLYVSDDVVSRFIQVSNPQISRQYIGDYRLEKNITIDFLAEYPFWEDAALTQVSNTMTGDGTFTVDNTGSDFLVLPIIEFHADQSADVSSVRLRNLSDGGMSFTYIDSNFQNGDILIFDSFNGTVRLNNNDTIANMTEPRFLRLQNVVNTFSYEGNAVTIIVKFRKVYV